MIDAHKELLSAVNAAEQKARVLYAKGAAVDEIIHKLKNAGDAVKERIRQYGGVVPAARALAAATEGKKAAKAEAK